RFAVQHLRVNHATGSFDDIIGRNPGQGGFSALPHEQRLGEACLIEERRRFTTRPVLASDSFEPAGLREGITVLGRFAKGAISEPVRPLEAQLLSKTRAALL